MAKKRAAPETYDSDGGFVAADDAPVDKKPKVSSSKLAARTNKDNMIDDDGNPYWELSGKRRITVSEYNKKTMVSVREYYEKDGKLMPGKKGISMTLEQYATFVQALPQIEEVLKGKGESVPRPEYKGGAPQEAKAEEEDEGEDEEDEESEPKRRVASNGRAAKKRSNIEMTSEEDEDEE